MKPQEKLLDIVIYVIVISIISFCFLGCDKELNGEGTISLTVKYNGKPVDHGKATVKNNSGFEKMLEIDVYGEVYAPDLKPGDYSIHAEMYDYTAKKNFKGDVSVTVVSRSQMNDYKVSLELAE